MYPRKMPARRLFVHVEPLLTALQPHKMTNLFDNTGTCKDWFPNFAHMRTEIKISIICRDKILIECRKNTPSLDMSLLNGEGPRGLLKKSTSWLGERIDNKCNSLDWSFTLTIWQSMSIYFMHSWKLEFEAMWWANWLSQ